MNPQKKLPMVKKLRPGTLLERLRQLRKKDLAFVGGCLAFLIAVPVLEHFWLRGDRAKAGPGFLPGESPFEEGVYEPGVTGYAPGTPLGEAEQGIITPLNAPDPSALVMNPFRQPPPAPLKDALAAARRAIPPVSRAAGLPRPPSKLASRLGEMFKGGISGAGVAFPKDEGISQRAKGVPKQGEQRPLAGVEAVPDFVGAAGRSPVGAGGDLASLKQAADASADRFADPGASKAAEGAASSLRGAGGAGGQGLGGGSAGGSKGNTKDISKSPGESLAFLRAKMELEQEFKRKQWLWEKWREMGFSLLSDSLIKPLGEMGKEGLEALIKGTETKSICGFRSIADVNHGTPFDDSKREQGAATCEEYEGTIDLSDQTPIPSKGHTVLKIGAKAEKTVDKKPQKSEVGVFYANSDFIAETSPKTYKEGTPGLIALLTDRETTPTLDTGSVSREQQQAGYGTEHPPKETSNHQGYTIDKSRELGTLNDGSGRKVYMATTPLGKRPVAEIDGRPYPVTEVSPGVYTWGQ